MILTQLPGQPWTELVGLSVLGEATKLISLAAVLGLSVSTGDSGPIRPNNCQELPTENRLICRSVCAARGERGCGFCATQFRGAVTRPGVYAVLLSY
jgi:hypothetical protein